MSYLEPILVHPVRRQNFRDTVAQKCNPYLIRCRMAGMVSKDAGMAGTRRWWGHIWWGA